MSKIFARLTHQRLKTTGMLVAGYLAIVSILTELFPGSGTTYAETFFGWLFGIPAVVLVWLTFEWIGTKLLGLSLWQRMSSPTRVMLIVGSVVAITFAIFIAVRLML